MKLSVSGENLLEWFAKTASASFTTTPWENRWRATLTPAHLHSNVWRSPIDTNVEGPSDGARSYEVHMTFELQGPGEGQEGVSLPALRAFLNKALEVTLAGSSLDTSHIVLSSGQFGHYTHSMNLGQLDVLGDHPAATLSISCDPRPDPLSFFAPPTLSGISMSPEQIQAERVARAVYGKTPKAESDSPSDYLGSGIKNTAPMCDPPFTQNSLDPSFAQAWVAASPVDDTTPHSIQVEWPGITFDESVLVAGADVPEIPATYSE